MGTRTQAWGLVPLLIGGLTGCSGGANAADAAVDADPSVDAQRADAGTGDAGGIDALADATGGDGGPADAGPPAVRFIGRFDTSVPAQPSFEWSGSAIEARFTGASVGVRLGGANNYFAVLVDGTVQPVLVTSGSTATYPIASGLAAGPHQVLVFRRDEAFDQPAQFVGFDFGTTGALLPPPPTPPHRIELIGDSISAGYGDECTNASMGFSQPTENEYIAYGPLTARALNADLHVVAWSGKGMYQNLDGSQTETMPILWQRTLPTVATSHWDPSQWIPDVVVINLGTNDYGAPGADPSASYQSTYLQFVTQLRSVYPHAYLFAAVGPMLGDPQLSRARAAIDAVVSMRHTAGDAQIARVEFPMQSCGATGAGCGCDYHPNAATHQAMATVLEAAIRPALGW